MNWKTDYKNRLLTRLTNASKQGRDAFVREINRNSNTYDLYIRSETSLYEVVEYKEDMRTSLLLETESLMTAIHYFVDLVVAIAE